jgi:hypothetical protein
MKQVNFVWLRWMDSLIAGEAKKWHGVRLASGKLQLRA